MKPEDKMWKYRLRNILKSISGVEYNRIETWTAVGIPDVAVSSVSGHGWIEMKVLKQNKNGVLILDTFTTQQYNWIKKRGAISGRIWVLVWDQIEDIFYLFDYTGMGRTNNKYFGCCTNALAIGDAKNTKYWIKILGDTIK